MSPLIPFLVATLGIALFALMDAVVKGLSLEMGAYNALLWRTLCMMLLACGLYLWRRPQWPEARVLRLHIWRGAVISVTAFLFFYGLVYIPLAEAIALSFIAPLLALYLAALLLGEQVGGRAVSASIIGFLGALIVIGGKLSSDYGDDVLVGIVSILMSATLYAYNLILQRQQALLAGPVEIVFFQTAAVLFAYLLVSPFFARVPPPESGPELVLAAGLSIVSLMLLSWAYARVEARILISVEYTAFIWAALLGWLMFREQLTFATLLGTGLIVAGCLLAASQKSRPVDHVETTVV